MLVTGQVQRAYKEMYTIFGLFYDLGLSFSVSILSLFCLFYHLPSGNAKSDHLTVVIVHMLTQVEVFVQSMSYPNRNTCHGKYF